MLTPQDLLDRLAVNGDDLGGQALMFCGTLPPLESSFVYGSTYTLTLRLPDGATLSHSYDAKRKGQ
jgi:hypothetical protein